MPNHIKERNQFQPRKNALKQWLNTRKSRRQSYGYVLEGFFSTHSYEWDVLFTMIGLAIEIGIFIFFIQQVEMSDWVNWIIFPIIVVLDLLFIYFVHYNKSSLVQYNNALLFPLNKDSNPLITDKEITQETHLYNHYKLRKETIISYLGIFAEIISCILKLYYIDVAYGLSIEPISIGIVVGYVFQTSVYIFSAGYFWAAFITHFFYIDWQYRRYRNFKGAKREVYLATVKDIYFDTPIKLKVTKNNCFELIEESKDSYEDSKHHYQLLCIGIPLDSDIIDFASLQDNNEARKEMMSRAHLLQLSKFAAMG